MKKYVALLSAILLFFTVSFSQKKSFDIFNYKEPTGWKKDSKEGVIVYTLTDEKKGTFCMIGLYTSKPGQGDPVKDFAQEWQQIAVRLGVTETPQQQPGDESNGWKLVIGSGKVQQNGGAVSVVILNTISGYNKVADLLFVFNDAAYLSVLQDFSSNLELSAPDKVSKDIQTQNNNNNTSGSQEIIYTAPKSWHEVKNTNGSTTISSPLLECNDNSYYLLHILNVTTYTGSLQEFAKNLHQSYFYQPSQNRPYADLDANKKIIKGINDNGYEYLLYETGSYLFPSDDSWHYGMVYLLRSGNQVISMLVEIKPTNANVRVEEVMGFYESCLPLKNTFNKFIATVKFSKDQGKESYVPDDLVGKWESRITLGVTYWGIAESRIVEKYTFMDDGRFTSQKMMASNSFGKYSVSGNKLIITDAQGKTVSYRFKLESIYQYAWHRVLTLFDANGNESKLGWEGE